jgi:predicted nucleic acid-binding protein
MSDPFFDTNILIDWLFSRGGAEAELGSYERHRISRIVWAELLAGETPDERPTLIEYLKRFQVIEVDEPIAASAADFRQRTRVKLLDSLIYATARHHGALLITRNTKDFPPGTPGIRVPYTL